MNSIIVVITVFSFICSIVLGKQQQLSTAAIQGAASAVTLVISITGGLCFWSGIMNVAKKAGICTAVEKIILPIIKIIFPRLKKGCEATKYIAMNITANLLGLGNAATPLGIKAMHKLNEQNPYKDRPSDEMITLAVINSSSIQILPTTLSVIRASYGCKNPMDIVPAVIVTSILSLSAGLIVCKGISLIERKKK